jgi:NAD(P)-dependent dehydrogenase (short-subunit alcohol dehydrogenase family)
MKNAMVWGASGGIGRALVAALAEDEWTVLAVARRADDLDDLTPYVFEADVSQPGSVEQAVSLAAYEVDAVHLWVYTAGDIAASPVDEMTAADWRRILDANLTGAFLAAHYSMPLLAGDAHLVFLGAISERLRLPGLAAYATAKAGLEAFADTLRKEQRKRRVTVVRPAAVATPLWDKVPLKLPSDAASPEQVARRILEAHREGHKGTLDLAH